MEIKDYKGEFKKKIQELENQIKEIKIKSKYINFDDVYN